MRYQRLDLNLLIALRTLLAERNVTRAGESLHMSQSAMSGVLARLREYFDDPLIVPVGRRMELTPLAANLVEKVNDLLLRVDATLATRPEFDPATSRREFSIVVSDYCAQVLLIDVLRDVHRLAPGLRVVFHQPSNTASADLDNGEVDFVINPERFVSTNQSSCVLFEDGYVGVVDASRTDIGDAIGLDDYRQARHVTMRHGGRPLFETWFAAEHGELERIDVIANNFALLPELVIGTARIATLHTRMALRAARQHPLRIVKLGFAVPRLVEVLQWHRYRDHDPASLWLRERLIDAARALPAVD